jgi:hypothetical protein
LVDINGGNLNTVKGSADKSGEEFENGMMNVKPQSSNVKARSWRLKARGFTSRTSAIPTSEIILCLRITSK